jgi:predicted dehydrogenase
MALRVGFVGCGNITDTHARAAREAGLEIAAFVGRDPRKAEAMAARHGGRACGTFESFLAHRPMDLVMIGSPSGLHAEHGIAATERGLHVLVEKPIDVATSRGEALVAAAERAGVNLGVLFQDRLKPGLVRLRGLLEAGGLGRVLLASARVKWHRPPEYFASAPWRGTLALDGGAALVNQGIHTVDLLLWLLGPVAHVQALTARQLHAIEGEDVALALLRFAGGAVATLEATTVAFPGYPRRVEITGTEGTVVVEGDRLVAADLRTPRPDLLLPATGEGAAASTAVVADATPHRRLVEDFARSIATGARPACDGREGLRSLAVVEAVYAAAARPGGVEVSS